MKLQLDTINKTIKIEESVKLTKLMQVIKKMLPNGEWQDFTLLTNTVIEHWSSPIIYKEYYPIYPARSWYEAPWYNNIHYVSGGNSLNMQSSSNSLNGQMQYSATGATNSNKANAVYELKSGVYNVKI